MKTSDYRNAFLIGIASAILWFFVLQRLSLLSEGELAALTIAIPFLSVLAVRAAHAIFSGPAYHKFAKFLMVGMLNTGVDFFVFNTLIAATAIDRGAALTLFKAISWSCAMANSYFLNRAWTFGEEAAGAGSRKGEFARFAVVTLVGFFLNVGTTSLIANVAVPPLGISQVRWDNIAAIVATALNLIWNFIGYKLFVFKSKGIRSAARAPEPELI